MAFSKEFFGFNQEIKPSMAKVARYALALPLRTSNVRNFGDIKINIMISVKNVLSHLEQLIGVWGAVRLATLNQCPAWHGQFSTPWPPILVGALNNKRRDGRGTAKKSN